MTKLSGLMEPKEAAEYLGIALPTLYSWLSRKTHKIPVTRVGSKLRFRQTDLEKYLEKHTENKPE